MFWTSSFKKVAFLTFLLRTTVCPFKPLVVLFTLWPNVTDHVCLEGGSVELQEAFGIRSELKLGIKAPVWLGRAVKAEGQSMPA